MAKDAWDWLDEEFGHIEMKLKDMEIGGADMAGKAVAMCEQAKKMERELARLRESLRGLGAHLAEVERDKAA